VPFYSRRQRSRERRRRRTERRELSIEVEKKHNKVNSLGARSLSTFATADGSITFATASAAADACRIVISLIQKIREEGNDRLKANQDKRKELQEVDVACALGLIRSMIAIVTRAIHPVITNYSIEEGASSISKNGNSSPENESVKNAENSEPFQMLLVVFRQKSKDTKGPNNKQLHSIDPGGVEPEEDGQEHLNSTQTKDGPFEIRNKLWEEGQQCNGCNDSNHEHKAQGGHHRLVHVIGDILRS